MKRNYVSASEKYCTREVHVSAPLLRRAFEWKTPFQRAKIEISAVGFYRLFFNGRELTKGFFAPYISNPDDLVYYDEYDVTALLSEENVICILLGNGFGNSMDNNLWDFEKASFRAAPKAYLGLYVDGERVLSTEDEFTACNSPITYDDLRGGERFDARLIDEEILRYRFQEDERFHKAINVIAPKGEYKLCKAAPVLAFETIAPTNIFASGNGYIYDFGQENTGLCRLKIKARAGQRVDMTFGECVANGTLDLRSITFGERSPKGYVQHDVYICKEGEQEYLPSFTYHGFRYAYVEGITESQATKDLLTFVVIHADMPSVSDFSCNNDTVNRLQECTLRSDTSNFMYFPTDCPQREKNGWTGDTFLSAEQLLYNFDCAKSLKEWLCNIRKAQTDAGALPGIVPTAGWGYVWGNGPAWDGVLIEAPYQIYRFTGDTEVIAQNADAIVKYCHYVRGKRNERGLVAFGLGDWCEAGCYTEDAYSTPLEVTDTLVCVDIFKKAAELLYAVGDCARAEEIEAFYKSLQTKFRKQYVQDGRMICETQTALAMAIATGIVEGAEKRTVYNQLLRAIERENNHFKVGIIGIKPLLNVLADMGDGDLALKLIIQPSFPSYAYNLNRGATTLWEAFQEFTDEPNMINRKDGGERILSFNHHFWGTISTWFIREIGGIKVKDVDTVVISPKWLKEISCAQAKYGRNDKWVKTTWKKQGEKAVLTVDVKGYQGELVLQNCVMENGKTQIALSEGTHTYAIHRL